MLYEFWLEIPANTPQTEEITKECYLSYGVIEKVDIQFPSGCCGFAHMAIDKGLHQILPANSSAYFTSDDSIITSSEQIELIDRPWLLVLRGYNTDDTYKHTVYVRVYVAMPKQEIQVITGEEINKSLLAELSK